MKVEAVKRSWDHMSFDVYSCDGTMNMHLRAWLDRHHIEPDVVVSRYGLFVERNQSAELFLERASKLGLHSLCMIDADMSPLRETSPILTAPGDLVYCGYSKSNARCVAHYGDNDLGGGCMRVSVEVLKAIEPPWFGFETNKKGTAVTTCECRFFLRKARKAGFESKMVGVIGHLAELVVRPDPNDPTKTLASKPGESSP